MAVSPIGAGGSLAHTADACNTCAAVDLGSNSFHLLIARIDADGSVVVLDKLRDMVRLAAGFDAEGNLTQEARARALAALNRFGERLHELPAANVRVVGTDTLRRAKNADRFTAAAEAALGHPIEVISGMEEARLIYLGVAQSLAETGRRLVIDIGGGSTEFIVGEASEPLYKASLHMGCVGHSERFFAGGKITREAFDAAELAARVEIEPIEARFRELDWRAALGASGTIKAVAAALQEAGWTQGTITWNGLERLRKRLIKAGRVERADLSGIKPERYPVFPGGVAILRAAFRALGIERMRVADGALREGIMLDLPGRIEHTDIRGASVARLAERFHADGAHNERIARTAEHLFDQAAGPWALDEECRWLLRWAIDLHEIGLDIAHSGYHKHGAYIVDNTDLAGFAQNEQQQLAALVRAHRRKFPADRLGHFPAERGRQLQRTAVLLRLAILLHRSRSDTPRPAVDLQAQRGRVRLGFPERWLHEHPLTRTDLAEEAKLLDKAGFELAYADEREPA
jgi:exopolyphosphatase/guanosine-5'-triphosphate,3'-diphosphate pyrophosphatase